MDEFDKLHDEFNEFSKNFFDVCLKGRVGIQLFTFYKKAVEEIPPVLKDGIIYSSMAAWLRYGKETAVDLADEVILKLVDRRPFWNDDKKIWYWFSAHGEDRFDPKSYDAYEIGGGLCNVPTEWTDDITFNKIAPASSYQGAQPISGWETPERAMEELGKAALRWAKTPSKEN